MREIMRVKFAYVLWAVALCASVNGQVAISDGFESGGFQPGWATTSGVSIRSGGGASNTQMRAVLEAYNAASGRELGARFDSVAPDGARDFYVDFYFRVTNTTQRQFNLHVSDSTGTVDSGKATINLRYQSGWAAYNTAWQPISGLGAVTPGQWHRLRLVGRDWGTPSARYDLQLSDAGGSSFTSSAIGLSYFQNGNPASNAARFFVFTTVYGNNPGFEVDEVTAAVTATPPQETNAVVNIRGTYPHLAVFSSEGECGIGAVVPWAGKLWFITYPPHQPEGSADKLWMVETNLTMAAHPASVGGTHANRMIHRESGQLIIGPYFIASNGTVRAADIHQLRARLTATTRHLTDPSNKVFFVGMERELYEVDVNTLAVARIYGEFGGPFPGYHGKGAWVSQGRLIVGNNGESGWQFANDPGFNGPAGGLSETTGENFSNAWTVVERKNFTEVTGPGGLYGAGSDDEQVWSLGWDKRSVLLKLREGGVWRTYRLPKGSYTHDALHGWYTEWPRIREITPNRLLMHMHGMFYNFPKTFSAANTGGLSPICTYLKMPVDYCFWNGQLVMGRDDASTTGGNPWAGQSHSALWFGQLSDLEQWGPPAGFGGLWKQDAVTGNTPSEPFLVSGFRSRVLHLWHGSGEPVNFSLQYDADGSGSWRTLTTLSVPAGGYVWHVLPANLNMTWVRLIPDRSAQGVTAYFHLGNPPAAPLPDLFDGLADATATQDLSEGIIRPMQGDARTLQFAATLSGQGGSVETAYYEMGGSLQLRRVTNATAESTLRTTYGLSNAAFSIDAASVIYQEGTNRFRIPRTAAAYDNPFAAGWPRGLREVVTERNLFQAHGTFYEVPRSDAGGFRRVRPVATHNKRISDFASWRGMLVLAGVANQAGANPLIYRSDDGRAALWFGNVDDLWRLGPPRGIGGPWSNSVVTAGVPSDPYLMFGYEHKTLELRHDQPQAVTFIVEVDVCADNTWVEYGRFSVPAGQTYKHVFPAGYSAHWVRLKTTVDTTATAIFTYGPAMQRQAFVDWAVEQGLAAGSAGELMNRDDDGDGMCNFIEYGLGGNPVVADRAAMAPVLRLESGRLRLTVTERATDSQTSSVLETSPNFTGWTLAPAAWELDGVDQSGVAPGYRRRVWEIPMSGSVGFLWYKLISD